MTEWSGAFWSISFLGWGLDRNGGLGLRNVSSACFSIMVNESPKGFFPGPKRSKTREPLSPFPFVFIVEAFSIMVKAAIDAILIRGFQVRFKNKQTRDPTRLGAEAESTRAWDSPKSGSVHCRQKKM